MLDTGWEPETSTEQSPPLTQPSTISSCLHPATPTNPIAPSINPLTKPPYHQPPTRAPPTYLCTCPSTSPPCHPLHGPPPTYLSLLLHIRTLRPNAQPAPTSNHLLPCSPREAFVCPPTSHQHQPDSPLCAHHPPLPRVDTLPDQAQTAIYQCQLTTCQSPKSTHTDPNPANGSCF